MTSGITKNVYKNLEPGSLYLVKIIDIDNPKIKLDVTTARNNNNVFVNKLVTFQD